MAERELINPTGGASMSSIVSDFRTFKDTEGGSLALHTEQVRFQASGAIALGDLVSLVSPTAATTPLRVKQAATADIGVRKIGVALNAAAATGDPVDVCIGGFCFVNVGSGTPAADGGAVASAATAGLAATATIDATTVAGTVLGVFLGTKDAANRAPLWLQKS
jgi:hypothetical protein